MKPVCAVLNPDARSELRAAGQESLDTSKCPWCNDALNLKKTGLIDDAWCALCWHDVVLAHAMQCCLQKSCLTGICIFTWLTNEPGVSDLRLFLCYVSGFGAGTRGKDFLP